VKWLDQERAYLIAMPFKKRGKNSMKISDFIFALSLDLKWGPPERVRALLREAEAEGLVRIEEDMVHASADTGMMEIPLGFKPSSEEGVLEKGIRLIVSHTGLSKKEAIALANEKQESLKGLVDLEAVVLLVAREQGLDVGALAAEAYQNLIDKIGEGEGL
jgi:hypothetical protein